MNKPASAVKQNTVGKEGKIWRDEHWSVSMGFVGHTVSKSDILGSCFRGWLCNLASDPGSIDSGSGLLIWDSNWLMKDFLCLVRISYLRVSFLNLDISVLNTFLPYTRYNVKKKSYLASSSQTDQSFEFNEPIHLHKCSHLCNCNKPNMYK